MNIKEKIISELDELKEEQLLKLEHYLEYIKHNNLNERDIARLYKECGDEDVELAEEGMEDYSTMLSKEDYE